MIRVHFTRQFDWPYKDPHCNCKRVVSYKQGWSGLVHDDVANAAIEARKAEAIGETSDNQSDTASADISPQKRSRRNRARSG